MRLLNQHEWADELFSRAEKAVSKEELDAVMTSADGKITGDPFCKIAGVDYDDLVRVIERKSREIRDQTTGIEDGGMAFGAGARHG